MVKKIQCPSKAEIGWTEEKGAKEIFQFFSTMVKNFFCGFTRSMQF
jgi:hypothetical protein